MKYIIKLIRFIFLSQLSIILLTPVFSVMLIYVSMDIAMQYVRNDIYNIPWFDVWFYTPQQIIAQMTYFQSINSPYLAHETIKAATISKMILLDVFIVSTGFGVFLFINRYKYIKNPQSDRYGKSRWAGIEEIMEKGLLDGDGLVIGQVKVFGKYHYLQHNGPEPIIGIGPTRSGKGVGWVIPSALLWKHSAVINDPKGEIWDLTADSRRKDQNNKCMRLALLEMYGKSRYKNIRINCLDIVKYGTYEEVANADTIATIISNTGDLKKDYWEEEAKEFIKAVILHIVYTKPHGNLTDVSFFVDRQPEETLYEMISTNHAECLTNKKIPEGQIKLMVDYWGDQTNKNVKSIALSLYGMLSKKRKQPGDQFNPQDDQQGKGAEAQLQGIIGGARRFLRLYQDPIIASNIAQSDFNLEDLYNYETPVSLYIVVSPSKTQQERVRPLVRLINSLILDKFQENREPKKYPLNFLIDEFPLLKRMEDIEEAFGTVAGYGLKFFLILQSIQSLEKYYGQNQTLYSNAQVRLIYSSSDDKTKKMVSSNSGNYTYVGPVISHTKSGGIWGTRSTTTTMQESPKPIVTPDQVEKLPDDKMFIFIKGMNAIKCNKANYRNDPVLLAKTKTISYTSDVLRSLNFVQTDNINELTDATNLNYINPLMKFRDFAEQYKKNKPGAAS